MACTVIGISPKPVMKMMGKSLLRRDPFLQLEAVEVGHAHIEHQAPGAAERGYARNACAEANASGRCQPS